MNLEKTRTNAIARREFTGEPTIPVRSRSNDFTIQGSNGSVISLTNRNEPETSTIDLAVGLIDLQPEKKIKNSDGYEESIKPVDSIELDSKVKSRVTISQKFNSDKYYELSGDDSGDIPTIVIKTDAVRILAKNDAKIFVGPNDSQSSIEIKNGGNIIITPYDTIYLSGAGSDQPYLRYDEFRRVISGLEDATGGLQTGLTKLAVIIDSLASGAASVALSDSLISIGNAISDVEVAMGTIRSTKIMGS